MYGYVRLEGSFVLSLCSSSCKVGKQGRVLFSKQTKQVHLPQDFSTGNNHFIGRYGVGKDNRRYLEENEQD